MTIYRACCLSIFGMLVSSPAVAGWDSTTGTYTWDPLITAASFEGVFTDLKVAVFSVLTVALLFLGVGLLLRALRS